MGLRGACPLPPEESPPIAGGAGVSPPAAFVCTLQTCRPCTPRLRQSPSQLSPPRSWTGVRGWHPPVRGDCVQRGHLPCGLGERTCKDTGLACRRHDECWMTSNLCHGVCAPSLLNLVLKKLSIIKRPHLCHVQKKRHRQRHIHDQEPVTKPHGPARTPSRSWAGPGAAAWRSVTMATTEERRNIANKNLGTRANIYLK